MIGQTDTLAISPTSITAPAWLSISWETVARSEGRHGNRGVLYCTVLYCTVLYYSVLYRGVFKPNQEFEENIPSYRYNKFLNIGGWSQLERAVNEPSRSFTVPVAPTGATSARIFEIDKTLC